MPKTSVAGSAARMRSDSSIPLILGVTRSRKIIPRTYLQESVETGFWICCHQDINTCLFQRGANYFQVPRPNQDSVWAPISSLPPIPAEYVSSSVSKAE
jgi:hypothetical protein